MLSAESSSPIQVFVKGPDKMYTVNMDRHQRAMCLYIRLKVLSGQQQQHSLQGCTAVCVLHGAMEHNSVTETTLPP